MKQQRPTYQGHADDTLVHAARCGDERAFALLLERHRSWVCRLIHAVVQDQEYAEDLTQETFCRVHRHLYDYTASGQFVPWLKRIALNLARNALRDRMSERRRQSAVALHTDQEQRTQTPTTDPAAILASNVIQQEIRTTLERLTPEQRQAVTLHYFGGLSVREIAQQTGYPEGTIKTRLFHARRQIREALDTHPTNETTGDNPDER